MVRLEGTVREDLLRRVGIAGLLQAWETYLAEQEAGYALISQRQLLQTVWGPQYERETNYLRVYLAQLRRKLEPDPAQPRHLITEPGMGYRFET